MANARMGKSGLPLLSMSVKKPFRFPKYNLHASSGLESRKGSDQDKLRPPVSAERKRPASSRLSSYIKVFMKQWKKDLADIEKRNKERRKLSEVKLQAKERAEEAARKENGQNFDDYLKLENTKASEGWSNAREMTSPSSVQKPSTVYEELQKKYTTTETENTPKLGSFEEFFENKRIRALMKQNENENHTYEKPENTSRGTSSAEQMWSKKFERARAHREKIIEKMKNSNRNKTSDESRLMRLKAFLNKQELDKIANLKKEYEKKIWREERRQRETARILKVVRKIHEKKNSHE